MKRRGIVYLSLLAVTLCLTLIFKSFLDNLAVAGTLTSDTVKSARFRSQDISPEAFGSLETFAEEQSEDVWEVLAVTMIVSRFRLEKPISFHPETYQRYLSVLSRWRPDALKAVETVYRSVWADASCMPVRDMGNGTTEIGYENGWMDARGADGERKHEGTDIFCWEAGNESPAESGIYPVVSMTDGYVENVGWLPLGGNRIGIRSDSGGYFYYAHLSDYARDFQAGERVSAGELLGYMGDTGYGPEGTTGQFPVHLHLGIYFNAEDGTEISVNPYPLLRILDNAGESCKLFN